MATWWNRNVAGMTLTSLLSDACYEMVLAVLPGFLPVIGVSAAVLGWIEGASDAFSSFLKLASGWYSDRIGHRKRMVVAGYFFTGTGLSLFALAWSWPLILMGRMISWFGKGVRGSLRDAMLSESVPAEVRGKAFGAHRAGDTIGAVLGPLAGVVLLGWLPHTPPDRAFREIFLFSLIPGLAAPLAFLVMVHETRREPKPRLNIWSALGQLPGRYRRFLGAVGIFGAGDFSPALLVLAAAVLLTPAHGAVHAAQLAALFYVLRNIVYSLASFPAGALGDFMPKRKVLAVAYLLGALASLGAMVLFAKGIATAVAIGLLFALSGVFAALHDTTESALPPELTGEELRGTAYGALGAVNGFGDLIASALVGTLWTVVSPAAAFGTAGVLMAVGALGVFALVR